MRAMYSTVALLLISLCSSFSLRAQWTKIDSAGSDAVWAFTIKPNGQGGVDLYAGTTNGVLRSTDDGATWTPASSGLTSPNVHALAVLGSRLFAGTWSGGVFFSDDNGTNWNTVDSGSTLHAVHTLLASGPDIFAGTSFGVYRSADSGATWTVKGLTGVPVFALAEASGGESEKRLWAGTGDSVFYSDGTDTNWTPASSGLKGASVSALVAHGSTILAGTRAGINRSTDAGASWNLASTVADCRALAACARSTEDSVFFAGNRGTGVYCSRDGGVTWTPANTGIATVDVRALLVHPATGASATIFAGINATGIWRRPLSEIATSVPGPFNEKPASFSLAQNYPNPFNPTTTIQYALPHRSHVTLTVYTTLGQQVATVVSGELEAGYHEVRFTASGLASGVYFYRLEAGDFTQTKILSLVR